MLATEQPSRLKTELRQKPSKDIKTMNSCQNTTESSVKATNGSELYLLNAHGTK